MLRPTPLRRYLSVMKARGHPLDAVLAGTGVDARQLDEPQYLIETAQYQQIVENMVTLCDGEALGLEIGLQRDVRDFGILGYAALSCRSIRHSVEDFWGGPGGYGDTLGMLTRIIIPRDHSEIVTVGIGAPRGSVGLRRFIVEEALCLLLKIGTQVSGEAPRFTSLQLAYPTPAYAARYGEIFDCPVRFDAERTRASFNRAWFEKPLQSSDPELIALYSERLAALRQQIHASQPLTAHLHTLFTKRQGAPSLGAAARELGLSPRTLRRKLQCAGHTYRGLANEFRRERAQQQVRMGRLPTKQISEEAGFADVNAFRRAFKAWTGQTVREYREKP